MLCPKLCPLACAAALLCSPAALSGCYSSHYRVGSDDSEDPSTRPFDAAPSDPDAGTGAGDADAAEMPDASPLPPSDGRCASGRVVLRSLDTFPLERRIVGDDGGTRIETTLDEELIVRFVLSFPEAPRSVMVHYSARVLDAPAAAITDVSPPYSWEGLPPSGEQEVLVRFRVTEHGGEPVLELRAEGEGLTSAFCVPITVVER